MTAPSRWHAMQVGGHVPLYVPHTIHRTYTDLSSKRGKQFPPTASDEARASSLLFSLRLSFAALRQQSVTAARLGFLTHDGDVARGARMRPRGHSCLWVRPAPCPAPKAKGRPRRRPRPRGRPQWRRPRLPVPHAGAGRNSSDFSPATMSKPRPGSTSIWKRSSIS